MVIYIVKMKAGKRYFASLENAEACFPEDIWKPVNGQRGERLFFKEDGEYGVIKTAELADYQWKI